MYAEINCMIGLESALRAGKWCCPDSFNARQLKAAIGRFLWLHFPSFLASPAIRKNNCPLLFLMQGGLDLSNRGQVPGMEALTVFQVAK